MPRGSAKLFDFAVGQLIERLAARVKAHSVRARTASNEVGVAIRRDHEEIVARSPIAAVPAAGREKVGVKIDGVVAASAIRGVGAPPRRQKIVPQAAMQLIRPDPITDDVGAIPAKDSVTPSTPAQPHFRGGATPDGVVAGTTVHIVSATPRRYDVVTPQRSKSVAPRRADKVIIPIGPLDHPGVRGRRGQQQGNPRRERRRGGDHHPEKSPRPKAHCHPANGFHVHNASPKDSVVTTMHSCLANMKWLDRVVLPHGAWCQAGSSRPADSHSSTTTHTPFS